MNRNLTVFLFGWLLLTYNQHSFQNPATVEPVVSREECERLAEHRRKERELSWLPTSLYECVPNDNRKSKIKNFLKRSG